MADEPKEEKKESKATSKNVTKLVEEISKLSVLELSELVNELQDTLGVSAMPMAAAPAAAPAGGEEAGGSDDAGGGTVVITAVGDNKIGVIKAIREIDQNITLSDAKGMTESLPAEIVKDAKPDDAKVAVEKLKAAGATVEVK